MSTLNSTTLCKWLPVCLQPFLAKLTWINTRHEMLGHVYATTAHWINPWLTAPSYLGARRLLIYARFKRANKHIMNGGAIKPTFLLPFPLVLSLLAQILKTGTTKFVGRDAPADQRHLVRVVMSLGVRVKGGCIKPSTPGSSFLFPATTFYSIELTGNTLSGQGKVSRKLSR